MFGTCSSVYCRVLCETILSHNRVHEICTADPQCYRQKDEVLLRASSARWLLLVLHPSGKWSEASCWRTDCSPSSLVNLARAGCPVSQAGYQDTVLINICFLANVHSLFWREFLEYEISIIKILKPAMFCFLQCFFQNGINSAAFITQQTTATRKSNFFPCSFLICF